MRFLATLVALLVVCSLSVRADKLDPELVKATIKDIQSGLKIMDPETFKLESIRYGKEEDCQKHCVGFPHWGIGNFAEVGTDCLCLLSKKLKPEFVRAKRMELITPSGSRGKNLWAEGLFYIRGTEEDCQRLCFGYPYWGVDGNHGALTCLCAKNEN